MEKNDTKQLLEILKASYPNHYRKMGTEEMAQTLALYHEVFTCYPTPVVLYALKAYVKVNHFPPTIAGLQHQIDLINPQEQSNAELWVLLEKAISRSGYDYVDEYNCLPEPVQAWLGNPIALHKLSQQDSNTTQGVTRGQFLKSIDGITERQKAQNQLPDKLRMLISGVSDKMRIEG